jgi:hypothetical protein
MRRPIAARDSDSAEFLLHARGETQSPCHQREIGACAEDRRRVQGITRAGMWLLFDQTFAACQENQKWLEKLSDRAALDDQPLMAANGLSPFKSIHRDIAPMGERPLLRIRY